MLRNIPRWLGTALVVFGVIVMPLCYYAVSLTLRHEAACAATDAACLADAAFWRSFAIAGFMTALVISMSGVIIDRLRRRR